MKTSELERIKEIYKSIDEFAVLLLKTYDIEVPIKDINELVSIFGGNIKVSNSFDSVKKTGADSFDIYINNEEYFNYKKFYIIHLLGRVLLHTNYLSDHDNYLKSNDFIFKPDNGLVSHVYQANEFAYGLLMPSDLYKKVFDENIEGDIVHTDKIASYFGVSISIASARGKRLGLIKD